MHFGLLGRSGLIKDHANLHSTSACTNILLWVFGINQTFFIFGLTQFLQLLGNQAKVFIVLSVFVIDGLK